MILQAGAGTISEFHQIIVCYYRGFSRLLFKHYRARMKTSPMYIVRNIMIMYITIPVITYDVRG